MRKQLHVRHQLELDHDNPGIPLHIYIVGKVTNSLTPHVGSTLKSDELEVYCASDDWTVTVT